MDVFDLAARITLDSSGFESGIGNAKNKMQGFVSDAGKFLGDIAKVSAAAVGAAATGAAAITKSSVGSYADYQQLTGGIETLFKGSSDVIKQYADEAYKTAGLSANDYMETATSFAASLISGLNGDTEEAARLTQMAITDMSDNANKMGSEMSSIQHAYDGFARGNFSMLDNLKLGYSGTQEEMFRLMQTAAELDETFAQTAEFSLDSKGHLEAEFADIVQAIHLVQEEMGITGTTAAEAADTVSGSVSTMKAAWENWLTGLGTKNADMSGLTQNLIDSFMTVKDNVEPVLRTIADNAVAVFKDLTNIDLAPAVEKIRNFGTAAQEMFTDLSNAYKEGGPSGVIDELITKAEELTKLDLTPVRDGFATIRDAFRDFRTAYDEGGIGGVIDEITKKFEGLTGIDLSPLVSGVRDFFRNFDANTGASLSGVVDSIERFIGSFADDGGSWLSVFNGFVKKAGEMAGIFGETLGKQLSYIADAFSSLLNTLSDGDLSKSLLDAVDSLNNAGERLGKAKEVLGDIFKALEILSSESLTLLGELVGGVASTIGELLAPVIDGLASSIQFVVGLLTLDFPEALAGLQGILSSTWEQIKIVWDWITDAAASIKNFGSNLFSRASAEDKQQLRDAQGVGPLVSKYSFNESAIGRSSSAAINSALVSSGSGDPININVNIDGKTAASALYEPMNSITKQRDK